MIYVLLDVDPFFSKDKFLSLLYAFEIITESFNKQELIIGLNPLEGSIHKYKNDCEIYRKVVSFYLPKLILVNNKNK